MENNKLDNLILNIYSNMNNIFREDEYFEPVMTVKAEEVNEEFFTAELMAMQLQFRKLTGQKVDILEFTYILNRLATQSLLENNTQFSE